MHKLGYIVKWHLVSAKPYNVLSAYPKAHILLYAQEHTNTHTYNSRENFSGVWCAQKRKQVEIAGSIVDANISDCYFILYFVFCIL